MKLTTSVDEVLAKRIVAVAKAERRSVSNLLRCMAERIVDEAGTVPVEGITHATQKLLRRNSRIPGERKI